MATQYVMQRDTSGWRMQVWLSFGISLAACAIGVMYLPGQELDRAFLAIGLTFCLFSSFAVAKTIRDNRDGQVDTSSWMLAVWTCDGSLRPSASTLAAKTCAVEDMCCI